MCPFALRGCSARGRERAQHLLHAGAITLSAPAIPARRDVEISSQSSLALSAGRNGIGEMHRRTMLRLAAGGWLAASSPLLAAPAKGEKDRPFDELLARYLVQGGDGINRVDYARWQASAADRAKLDDYLGALAARQPSGMARSEAFAYWANLYNAATLKVVIDRYPVASIRD